jgi:sigma-B regulation protein RsbU (phosphoserine phosphatase)
MDGQAPPGGGPRTGPAALDVTWASALVVDDIPENRDLLTLRLSRLGVRDIEEAPDGRRALQRLGERPFDLVLLDIMMPEMNGFEVLAALRDAGRLHALPVIVISALNEIESVARCLEQGAEDFIFKPFEPAILRARVLASLEKKQLRDRARQALERSQAELNEARRLQLAMTPEPLDRDAPCGRLHIEAMLEPAREVGGDLVDHFEVGGRLHAMLVGDVSDKGAGAALVMARAAALFRSLAGRPDAEALFEAPEGACALVNSALARANESCMFVTALLAVLDLDSGALAYVRCGHVPPFLKRADGALERLEGTGGLPLGLVDGTAYVSGRAALNPGERLLIVTDGVTEAASPSGALLGDEGALAWMGGTGPDEGLASLLATVRAHEAGAAASDDVAALLMRLDPR